MYTKEAMRARLSELQKRKGEIERQAKPLERDRDAHVAKYQAKEQALSKQIQTIRGPLYDIDMEIATLTRAVGPLPAAE